MSKSNLEIAKECGATIYDSRHAGEGGLLHHGVATIFPTPESLEKYSALKLESRITTIQEMFSNALQSDLEHGVKFLNENASKEFHEKYPELTLALRRLSDME